MRKIFMVLIGLLLLGAAAQNQALVFAGENKTASVTGVVSKTKQVTREVNGRRQTDTERYYEVRYRFEAPEGTVRTGHYDVSSNPPTVGSAVKVRVLAADPSVHQVGDEVSAGVTGILAGIGGLVMILLGIFKT